MEVRGLGWVGIRTERFEETVGLFRDVMGLEVIRQERNVVGFEFSDGAEMEVWRPEDEFHSFFGTGPVVGFRVDNFEEARARMEAEGVEFLTPTQWSETVAWSHSAAHTVTSTRSSPGAEGPGSLLRANPDPRISFASDA